MYNRKIMRGKQFKKLWEWNVKMWPYNHHEIQKDYYSEDSKQKELNSALK